MKSARPFARLVLLAATFAIVGSVGASAATSATNTNPKHFFWAPGQSPEGTVNSVANDIIYHGGNARRRRDRRRDEAGRLPRLLGAGVGQRLHDAGQRDGKLYSSKTLQNYVNSFFGNVGGSPWAGVQTQYCRNVLAGTTSCAGVPGADFITNPKHQLKGVWTDPTPVPADIVTLGLAENLVDDPIAAEAMRASAHFKYDPNATYIILTPPSTIATGQPVYCGYHTQTTSIDGLGNPYRIQYAFIPFLNTDWPGIGTGGCGMHNVNATSNAFGNGIFDGYSIVVGHEYSEAVTDPGQLLLGPGRLERRPRQRERRQVRLDARRRTSRSPATSSRCSRLWSNEAFDARQGRLRRLALARGSHLAWGTPTAWGFLAVRKFLGTVHASLRVGGQPVHMTKAKTRIALVGVGVLALAGGSTALASKSTGHAKGTLAAPRGGHGPMRTK